MPKTPPDWTRTGTIEGYAKWLQKASGALAVIVVRVNDSALAADPQLAPGDVEQVVIDHLLPLVRNLAVARAEKKRAARLELGALPE